MMNADSNNNEDVSKAVSTLARALREDPGYREAWVANIAMQFKDRVAYDSTKHAVLTPYDIHVLANASAESFIDLLCKEAE